MIVIDIIILIILGFFLFRGFKNGLIIELGSIVGLLAGLFLTSKFSHHIFELMQGKDFFGSQYLPQIAYIITFIIIVILVAVLAKILTKIAKFVKVNWLNKLGGLSFGFLKGILIVGGILFVLSLLQKSFNLFENVDFDKSILFKPISKFFCTIFSSFKELL